MSGGSFDYIQYRINDIIEVLDRAEPYEDADKDEFKLAIEETCRLLKSAFITSHRMDWYLSGDDSWDSYKERLIEDFEKEGLI